MMPFPAFTVGFYLPSSFVSLFHASFARIFFLHFPPAFHIVNLHFCVKTWVLYPSATTGFCFQLYPFPAPGMLLIAPFPFSPRPTVDKHNN